MIVAPELWQIALFLFVAAVGFLLVAEHEGQPEPDGRHTLAYDIYTAVGVALLIFSASVLVFWAALSAIHRLA